VEEDLQSTFHRLAENLEARAEPIADAHMERMRSRAPAWAVDSADAWARMREFGLDSIRSELAAFHSGELPTSCPEIDAEGARQGARIGGLLNMLLAGYRSGQLALSEAWMELVDEQVAEGGRRRAVQQRGNRFFFEYADRLSELAAAEYSQEREVVLRNSEQRRMHLVRELIEGHEVDAAVLEYPVDGFHIGVVAWGAAAEDSVGTLARPLDRRLLVVRALEETCWAWLGGRKPLSRLPTLPDTPEGTGVALGSQLEGIAGFRRSHRQAQSAARIARARGLARVRYEDVALEALASADPGEAEAFIARELAGLDGEGSREARLRETLEAWFAAGQNASAAAAALGVHEQTVAARLRAVETRTGRPVAARRAELETALRLCRTLPLSAD
jgi:PucR C-terminal helix-turn-helix domain